MTTEIKPSPRKQTSTKLADALRPPDENTKRLGVSFYERVSSMLLSLLIIVGVAVFGVVIIFFSSRLFHPATQAVPVTVADIEIPHEGSPGGSGRDLEEPATEEIPELVEPPAADKLAAVTDAVTSRETMFEDIAMDGAVFGGQGRGFGKGNGIGDGDGGRAEKVPRAERWEIRFQASDLVIYARTLDFFGIELAMLDRDANAVQYAFNLSKPKPDRRTGPPDKEKRLYMTWRSGPLQAADRELLAKSGIQVGSNIFMQFYPGKVENDLAVKELQFAGNHVVDDIRKTVFGVKQAGATYSFFVIEQKYY